MENSPNRARALELWDILGNARRVWLTFLKCEWCTGDSVGLTDTDCVCLIAYMQMRKTEAIQ